MGTGGRGLLFFFFTGNSSGIFIKQKIFFKKVLTYSDRRGIFYYDRCSTTVVATTNKATSDEVKANEAADDEVTMVEDNPDAHRV